jgi:hypothetical protein
MGGIVGRWEQEMARKTSNCRTLMLDVLAKNKLSRQTSHDPRDAPDLISHIVIKPHIFIATNNISSKRIPYLFNTARMARLSTVNTPAPDPTSINLTRIIARLQRILISPDQETESKLRSSGLERDRVGTVRQPCPSIF